jgi:ribonuclease Z
MKLVFLGTSAAAPTVERNLSSVALEFGGEWLLFDCPEGTQRQMMASGVSFMKVEKIFLSHFHLDHILGLPGLLATMHMLERKTPLHIYGPRRIQERIKYLLGLTPRELSFEIVCHENRKGVIAREKTFVVKAFLLKHDVACWGYRFEEADKKGEFQREWAQALAIPEGPLWRRLQTGKSVKVNGQSFKPAQVMDYSKGRKGRVVCVVSDTMAHPSYLAGIRNADVLVHECTFGADQAERARETKHAVSTEVAALAKKAKVKQLALFHFSSRYRDLSALQDEARLGFENSSCATDGLEIPVPVRQPTP